MAHARCAVLACMVIAGLVASTESQPLASTCPLVKAAACLGQCSDKAPSHLRVGVCSPRRRGLLAAQEISASSAGITPAQPDIPPRRPPGPRPDWRLQPAPPPAQAQAAGKAGAGPPDTMGAGAVVEVPQKYLPYGINGTDPPETPQQQEKIIKHLNDLLSQPDNSSEGISAGGIEVYTAPPDTTSGQVPQKVLPHGPGGVDPPESQQQQGEVVKHIKDVTAQPDSSGDVSTGDTEVHTEYVGTSGGPGKGDATAGVADSTPGLSSTIAGKGDAAATPASSSSSAPAVASQAVNKPASPHHTSSRPQPSPARFTWTPLSWLPELHINRRLQQDQQQQGADSSGSTRTTDTAGQTSAPNPDAEAVPVLGTQPTDPSTALAGAGSNPASPNPLDFVPQCPAGTSFNSSEGTCISTADAFPSSSSSTQDTPLISTVKLEVPEGDQAVQGVLAAAAEAARQAPIDPGTEPTVVLGPDGVALGSTSGSTASVGTASGGGSTGDGTTEGVTRAVAPYDGPDSQVSRTLTMIGNSKIKVGIDLDRAGAISWVSSPLAPKPWTNENVVNNWDQGRLLQQSFYGCVDGSCWANRPWLWNPVQGGSWQNAPGLTIKSQVKAGAFVYAEGFGRNWGKQDLIKDVKFTTNVTLLDNVAVVKYVMSYTGKITQPYMTQEVPAVFVDRKFSVLAYYDGAFPWKNDKAIKYVFPPGRNIYARPTEFWAAYIDPATGWGLGVYNPMAWMGITAYRIGPDGADSRPWDCSYFAQTIRMQLHPGMKPYPYTVYVTVGRLDTIRATFYKLRTQPSVLAAQALTTAATRSTTPAPTLSPTQKSRSDEPLAPLLPGQPDLGRNTWYGQPLNYSMFDNVILEDGSMASGQNAQDAPGRTIPVDNVAPGVVGGGAQGKALAPGQFAGVIVGAVAGCVLMAAVVIVRAVQQRRQAASSASQMDLLASGDSYAITSSHPATRSPSVKGPSRSRGQSMTAGAGVAGSAAAAAAGARAGSNSSNSSSPEQSISRPKSQTPTKGEAGEGAEGGDGAVDVSAVTPGVVTRSAAKLGK